MDDVRGVVAGGLALTSLSRLIAIDAEGLVDDAAVAVHVATGRGGVLRGVVADPLRLPFVAAVADVVVVRNDLHDEPQARLREIWRVLAPAGVVVLVVPLPVSHGIGRLIARRIVGRRVARQLAAAMFEPEASQVAEGSLIVRAGKRDGLASPRRATVAVHATAAA